MNLKAKLYPNYDLINSIIDKSVRDMNKSLDDAIIAELNLKGFVFKDYQDLVKFCKTRCHIIYDRHNPRNYNHSGYTLYVDGNAVLRVQNIIDYETHTCSTQLRRL